MFKDMLAILHLLTHPFKHRYLVYEMAKGGGITYYLGCEECGGLALIDRYTALELKKIQEPIHIDDFYDATVKPNDSDVDS